MIKDGPHYSKKQIISLIDRGDVFLDPTILESAQTFFGWDIEQICKAIKKLQRTHCYKSQTRFQNPEIWVDYYRAECLLGENIYTHFYIEDDELIVDSFKRI